AVEAVPAGELLEAWPVGPVTGDDAAELRLGRQRVEQQVNALRSIQAADGEEEPLVPVAAEVELLRRRQDDLGLEPQRTPEPVGDVARDRAEPRRLAERLAVEPVHGPSQRPVFRRLAELAELRPVEVVRLPELVHEPDDLARV